MAAQEGGGTEGWERVTVVPRQRKANTTGEWAAESPRHFTGRLLAEYDQPFPDGLRGAKWRVWATRQGRIVVARDYRSDVDEDIEGVTVRMWDDLDSLMADHSAGTDDPLPDDLLEELGLPPLEIE